MGIADDTFIEPGRAAGEAAAVALEDRRSDESALDLLDRVCKVLEETTPDFRIPGSGGRFYTDPTPEIALGMLMVAAFAPHGLDSLGRYRPMMEAPRDDGVLDDEQEEAIYHWEVEVYRPFRKRYGF